MTKPYLLEAVDCTTSDCWCGAMGWNEHAHAHMHTLDQGDAVHVCRGVTSLKLTLFDIW